MVSAGEGMVLPKKELTGGGGEAFDLEAATLHEEARDPETGLSHATLRADIFEELYRTEIGWVLHRNDRTDPSAESWEKIEDKAAAWLVRNGHELPPELKPE